MDEDKKRMFDLKIAETASGGSGLKLSLLNPGLGTLCAWPSTGSGQGIYLSLPHSQMEGGGGESIWIHR